MVGYAVAGLDGTTVPLESAHGKRVLHSADDDPANRLAGSSDFKPVTHSYAGFQPHVERENARIHIGNQSFDFEADILLDLLAERVGHLIDSACQTASGVLAM